MPKEFAQIRSKVRLSDISGVKKEFLKSISKGYSNRAPTTEETFYTMPDSENELLVSVKALRVRLSFPLDLFTILYFEGFGLTLN